MTKIPLWRTLGESIRQVFGELKQVVRLGWLPFLILTVPNVASTVLVYTRTTISAAMGPVQAEFLVLVGVLSLLVRALCYNAFMVSWYRHVLKASENVQGGRGYWSAFWRVLGYCLLTIVACLIAISLGGFVVGLVIAIAQIASRGAGSALGAWSVWIGGAVIIAAVPILLCFTRFSLVFPAAAYGGRLGIRSAWRKMRGNTWRMIASFLLVAVVFIAMLFIPSLAVDGDALWALISGGKLQFRVLPLGLAIGIGFVGQVVSFLFMAVLASIAAIFYRELVLRPGDVVEVFA